MSFTVASVLSRGLEVADLTNASSISATYQINSFNEAYRTAYELITESNDDYYVTIAAWAGENVIPLPADFFKLRAVDYDYNGVYRGMIKFSMTERNRYAGVEGDDSVPPMYRLQGANLYIIPEDGTYNGRIWYYPNATTYTASDTISFPSNLLPEFLAYECAVKFMKKMHAAPDAVATIQEDAYKYRAQLLKQIARDDSMPEVLGQSQRLLRRAVW
jgi:hypothetical protein